MDPSSARNLLNASELLEIQYTTASRGKRLSNYLLDLVIYIASLFMILIVWSLFSPILEDEASTTYNLIYYTGYVLYYSLFESILGKTPGKMITGTRVINEDGESVSFWQALGRSLSRLIPFDALTFIRNERPRGLHDQISGTWVVDDLKPNLYQPLASQTKFEPDNE